MSDPIAQSFKILEANIPIGVQGVYATSIDLFFEATDPTLGITFMIRNMVNGYPDITIVQGSVVHLLPNQINKSSNASKATNILFPEPVLLLAGQEYCFVLMPDGANPNYDVWTAVIGGKDVITGAPIYSQSSSGVMFLSSQNSTWTAYQSEAIKFNLYLATFNPLGGTATFVNDDSEYLTIANTSRVFTLGENVYYSNTILFSSNVGTSNTSNNVSMTSTSGILANSKIYIQSNTNNSTMVANVVSVSSGTILVINTIPIFTDANASLGRLTSNGGLSGVVESVNSSLLVVGNSTANSTVFLSVNNGIIIGASSLASATISALNDVAYDTLMPKFATSIPSICAISLKMQGTSNSSTGYVADGSQTALTFGQSTDFIDEERVVMSKSNEINSISGAKSLQIQGAMTSISPFITPIFDTAKAGAVVVQNLINGEDANNDVYTSEITNSGTAINKYISQTVTLAQGLEAEDLTVYIGAYYPPNTNIYVYGKILNQYDPDQFNLKAWTPMTTLNTTRSSKINQYDYNEYIFNFGNTAPSPQNYTAYLDSSNNNVVAYTSPSGALFETFNAFAVKIVLLSNAGSQLVPILTDFRAIATQTAS